MLFSVIVPAYNVARYLRRCLDSLVAQTCTDKEVIVVDDGSTDTTGSICDEYAARYPFVRTVHQANQGLSGARNTGIERATGAWLVFVDGDDYVDSDMLEQLQGYVVATDADMYRFGFTRGDEEEHRRSFIRPKRHTLTTFRSEQQRFHFYSDNFYLLLMAWRGIYRHSLVCQHGLRFVDTRTVFAEDALFSYQYFLHVRHVAALPLAPYHYLRHEGSLLTTTSVAQQLLRSVALGEREYEAVVAQRLPYFQAHFYQHYLLPLDMRVWNAIHMQHVAEDEMRAILATMMSNAFHRRCVAQALQEKAPYVLLRYSPRI